MYFQRLRVSRERKCTCSSRAFRVKCTRGPRGPGMWSGRGLRGLAKGRNADGTLIFYKLTFQPNPESCIATGNLPIAIWYVFQFDTCFRCPRRSGAPVFFSGDWTGVDWGSHRRCSAHYKIIKYRLTASILPFLSERDVPTVYSKCRCCLQCIATSRGFLKHLVDWGYQCRWSARYEIIK